MTITVNAKNIFLYWTGQEYKLIQILRNLIFLHNRDYSIYFLTPSSLEFHGITVPVRFYSLDPAHQADYLRVLCVCQFGGIWLDSDTLMLESLEKLFQIFTERLGFFVTETPDLLCNGVFGSRANTQLMREWLSQIEKKLSSKRPLGWTSIGSSILNSLDTAGYEILQGSQTVYPVIWNDCVEEYLNKPVEHARTLERGFQPLLILVNSVYKTWGDSSFNSLTTPATNPLQYFLQKSFGNLIPSLRNFEFIEIGTGDTNYLQFSGRGDRYAMYVEPIPELLESIPSSSQIIKICAAVVGDSYRSLNTPLHFMYRVPDNIEYLCGRKIPEWIRGCNTLDTYHPMHVQLRLRRFVEKIPVRTVISAQSLLIQNAVFQVEHLKIVTEGWEYEILKNVAAYFVNMPRAFYPVRISFQTTHMLAKEKSEILSLFSELSYTECTEQQMCVLSLDTV